MAITAYKTIRVYGLERLNAEVAALLADGYWPLKEAEALPQGEYLQTMVKGRLDPASADDVLVGEIETAGGTTIPAGTLTETLQAIADLADPV